MGLFSKKKNNRERISENVEILSILYDKIDKCFHENFIMTYMGQRLSECQYETNPNAFNQIESWQMEFKATLSDVLNLLANHGGSWLDTEEDKNVDKYNQERINELLKKYDQIKNILGHSHIRYRLC